MDLKLVGPGICWVEIKNATLLDGSTVVFPDTVSARATRHLGALRQAVERGERAVLLFHVGHEGGVEVRAASQIDPTYARALREAVGAGVEVLAYRARMSDAEIVLDGALPFTP